MKKLLSLVLFGFISTSIYSQNYDFNRYKTSLFPSVLVTNNVMYGEAPVWTIPYNDEDLLLNITVPNGDSNPKRPLIIFAHAGGFINGSKDVDDMVAICDSFARKGFVTATIDYRKGFNPTSNGSAERAVYRGIQDGKTAIRYFKTFSSLYDIDTNYVFFGGMSAGGFIATHVAYMDKESERPASTYGNWAVNDLGCLNCGSHQGVSSSVRGVLDYWGAVQDTALIEGNVPPMLIMHGENDPTVPFVYDHPFGVSTLPEVYGAQPIKERLDIIGGDYVFITSTGQLHMLDSSDNGTWDPEPGAFWGDTLLPETTDFIYNLIKPNTTIVSDQSIILCLGDNSLFEVSNGLTSSSHYEWDFDNASITTLVNNFENTISLEFPTTGTYSVKVIEYNEILCASEELEFTVEVVDLPIADFTYLANVESVDFTSTSVNGVTYAWDFGDGSTSTDQNPSHDYMSNGDFTVTLTTVSADGCESEMTTQIVTIESLGLVSNTLALTFVSPFTNELILNSSSPLNLVSIYSMDGKLIYSDDLLNLNTVINTTNWENGLYILRFTDVDGVNQQMKIVKI